MEKAEIKELLDEKYLSISKELKELRENGADKADFEKLESTLEEKLEEAGKKIDDFIEANKPKANKSFGEQIRDFLKENAEKLKDIAENKTGEIKLTLKAPESINTGSGTDAATFPATMHNNLGNFNLRSDQKILGMASTTSTNLPALSYTEMLPKDGDYTFVLEEGTKPQIDFQWENRPLTPHKIAAHEILSEESVTDVARLESVAREFLRKKHDLFKARKMIFSDGTGNTPVGLADAGRTFVSTSLTNVVPNGQATLIDVIQAAVTDVYRTQAFTDQEHYLPGVAMVNPIDFFKELVVKKDADGHPLYPQAGLFNEVVLGGVRVIPWINIPVGKVLVADVSVMNIVNYVPFSIRIGWINDQMITNQFTMVGESRYYQYVENLDQASIIYDDIATIKTAIEEAP